MDHEMVPEPGRRGCGRCGAFASTFRWHTASLRELVAVLGKDLLQDGIGFPIAY